MAGQRPCLDYRLETIVKKRMRYYNLRRYWTKRIVPHLDDKLLNDTLVREFNKFTMGAWKTRFKRGIYPEDIDYGNWRAYHVGPSPRFWRYVATGTCHWIVNFSLRLAMLAEPSKAWRIITSDKHSTVWDGRSTLFEFNYQAFGVTAQECFDAVKDGEYLPPGTFRRVGSPQWAKRGPLSRPKKYLP